MLGEFYEIFQFLDHKHLFHLTPIPFLLLPPSQAFSEPDQIFHTNTAIRMSQNPNDRPPR